MYSLDELKSFYDTGGDWTSDLACVPDLSERCMEAHFASSNRQQHKGWLFKEEKYIRRIECTVHRRPSVGEVVLLKSICLCSMKPGHYRQLVALKKAETTSVVQAHCDCVAG